MNSQDQLFEIIFDKEDVTWQAMLMELVKTEQMNPWDIDMKLLAQRFLEMVKTMKSMDFRIPGKVILAAAILLKIKSTRLLGEDLDALDRLFAQQEEAEGLLNELFDDYEETRQAFKDKQLSLIPRTPQPRKRKVSIYDLVDALQKAMEVKKRRVMRDIPPFEVVIPKKTIDIGQAITTIHGKIKQYFSSGKGKLTFTQLIPSDSKHDKVFTFIPLLHLTNQRHIDLEQYRHFGEIEVKMLQKSNKKELEEALA